MTLPAFSVITPSLNGGEFLEDAILSVGLQDNVVAEHIVIDGASTDGTVDILRRFPHVQWTSKRDGGQSAAINAGFLRGKGDLLGWLNADDYYCPGGLEAIARAAEAHPEADIVYGDCVFVDSRGRIVRSKVEHAFDLDILMYFGCYIPSTSTFFRRSVIDSGLLLDQEYRVCMDFEYLARLAHAGHRFHYVPKLIAAFRWHDSNVSLKQTMRRKEERHQVQRRYGVPCCSERALTLLANLHRGKRVVRKLLDGNLLRELTLRRMTGLPTRWQSDTQGAAVCASLSCL